MRKNYEFDQLPYGEYPWGFAKEEPLYTFSGHGGSHEKVLGLYDVNGIRRITCYQAKNSKKILNAKTRAMRAVYNKGITDRNHDVFAREAAAYSPKKIEVYSIFCFSDILDKKLLIDHSFQLKIGEERQCRLWFGDGRERGKRAWGYMHSHPSKCWFSDRDVIVMLRTKPVFAKFVFLALVYTPSNYIAALMINPKAKRLYLPPESEYVIYGIIDEYMDQKVDPSWYGHSEDYRRKMVYETYAKVYSEMLTACGYVYRVFISGVPISDQIHQMIGEVL